MFVSVIAPVEPLGIVNASAVAVVPTAPPDPSLMPPLPDDSVTPLPDADTIAVIVEGPLPVAVKLVAPFAVTFWLMSNDVPDNVNAPVDIAPPVVIAPAFVTLTLPVVVPAFN